MNVNTFIDACGLPRNAAENMPEGTQIIATVRSDGSVAVEVKTPSPLAPVKSRTATP